MSRQERRDCMHSASSLGSQNGTDGNRLPRTHAEPARQMMLCGMCAVKPGRDPAPPTCLLCSLTILTWMPFRFGSPCLLSNSTCHFPITSDTWHMLSFLLRLCHIFIKVPALDPVSSPMKVSNKRLSVNCVQNSYKNKNFEPGMVA